MQKRLILVLCDYTGIRFNRLLELGLSLCDLLRLHQINAFVVRADRRILLLGLGAGGGCRNFFTSSTEQGKSRENRESADAKKTCCKTGFIHRDGFPMGATAAGIAVGSLAKGGHHYSPLYLKSAPAILARRLPLPLTNYLFLPHS